MTEFGIAVTIQAYYLKGACEILRRIIGKRVKVPYGPAAVYAEQGSIKSLGNREEGAAVFDA